ncbi:MAG: glycosyltransferase family 39 protein [Alphaproteobacteria bacterium]|nr:glycosyltransferase family 39 protein [Alphaproteobacteria bacterium]
MDGAIGFWRRRPGAAVAIAIACLVALRIAVLAATPLELGPDEAQYWRWSRSLDWGYYSKPPLIAWGIAAATSVFGDAEWGVRLLAPIAHGLAGFFLFSLGRRAFDPVVGAWSAALYLLMPGVWLSSAIMSTDAVLLPMWTATLFCLWRLRETPRLTEGLLLGLALGLAMLAKYAALYLIGGAVLASLIDLQTRRALMSPGGLAALAVAALVLSPNLAWNAANDFATVSHTTDNANWNAATFDLSHFGKFLTDQMAVFGPVSFLVLLAGCLLLVRRSRGETLTRELWLICFIAPPLIVIAFQAVISRAHANWAATAYPAACVLLASWIARARWSRIIKAGVGLNAVVGVIFLVFAVAPSLGDAVGASNAFKRVRGWEETAAGLARIARENGASAVMFDEREIWHGVDYYGRDLDLPPVRSWRRLAEARSHAEEAGTLLPGEDWLVLVASVRPDFRPLIRADFASIEDRGVLAIPLGGGKVRELRLYLASGYSPRLRTPEFEAEFAGKQED